jgi:ribosomal protein L28
MSRFCEICERGPVASNSRSHSNIATRRRHEINLQMKTIVGKRTRLCARCIKTQNKKVEAAKKAAHRGE